MLWSTVVTTYSSEETIKKSKSVASRLKDFFHSWLKEMEKELNPSEKAKVAKEDNEQEKKDIFDMNI